MALGEILTDEAVGVLAGSPLPGMVRSREVEAHPGGGFDLPIAMELRSVVRGDRAKRCG